MSAFLVKDLEVRLPFSSEEHPTAYIYFEADFNQLDEAFRTAPKRKRRNLIESRSTTIKISLKLQDRAKFVAFGSGLEAFLDRHKKAELEMIFNATLNDGKPINCRMVQKQDLTFRLYLGGCSNFQWTNVLLPDRIYQCQFSVEVIDKGVFNFRDSRLDYGKKHLSFLHEQRHCDFTIVADNEVAVKCHRVILAGASPVLDQMLTQKRYKLEVNASEAVIKAFLEFVYCSELKMAFESSFIAVELLVLAHKYEVQGLELRIKQLILKRDDKWLDCDAGLKLIFFSMKNEGVEYWGLREKGLRIVKSEKESLEQSTVYQDVLRDEPHIITEFLDFLLKSNTT